METHGELPTPLESPEAKREEEQQLISENTGKFLNQVWQRMKEARESTPAEGSKDSEQTRYFIFRPRLDRGAVVHVRATEFNFKNKPTDEGSVVPLKMFNIALRPPEPGAYMSSWNVQELAAVDGTKYESMILHIDKERESYEREKKPLPPDLDQRKDPDVAEMREALRVMEEAWQLYRKGNPDVIEFWNPHLPEADK